MKTVEATKVAVFPIKSVAHDIALVHSLLAKPVDGMRRALSLMFRNSLDVSKMWDLWKEISSGCVLKRWTPGSAASACAARPQRNARIDSGDRIMVLSLDAVIRTPTEL